MKKKVAAALLAISCGLVVRCATAPSVFKEVVQDSAGRETTVETVTVHVSNDLSGNIEVIRMARLTEPEGISYMFRVSYGGPNRRFMAGPITIVIADQEVELETVTDGIHQTLLGKVPPEVVEGLFTADNVSIQYWGQPVGLTGKEIDAVRALAPRGK